MAKTMLAAAWLKQNDWPRWQALDSEMPSFERWQQKIDGAITAARLQSVEVVKIDIDPDVYVIWCKARGLPVGSSSRSTFAAETLMLRGEVKN